MPTNATELWDKWALAALRPQAVSGLLPRSVELERQKKLKQLDALERQVRRAHARARTHMQRSACLLGVHTWPWLGFSRCPHL